MRLIDADALKRQIAAATIQDGSVNAASRASALIQIIDMQPEIGNIPRKPVVNRCYYFCPACGSRRSTKQKHNYCHDCGQEFDWKTQI